ncbi:unnamed protein product, partial [Meganyctiphanes norvegica]
TESSQCGVDWRTRRVYGNMKCLSVLILALAAVARADEDATAFDADTFEEAVANKPHFVMFFAPWCGHCKRLHPTWNDLGKKYNTEESTTAIGKVDCTQHTALCSSQDVTGYPT